jgi:hypothetical protein
MPLLDPVSAAWNTVAKFADYENVQRAVDRLSDDGFRSRSSTLSDQGCGSSSE